MTCFDNVVIAVSDLWERPLLQHYTDHSTKHSDRIIKALGQLLAEYANQLTEFERFILLSSAYLHDIGMQSPAHAGLVKKNRYSEDEENQIRIKHNEASAKMIIESLSQGSQLNLGLGECTRCADFIANVCKYHRDLPLDKLADSSIFGEKVRIRLLAGLLRLGDELDADSQRVFMKVLKTRDIPSDSKYHWWAHHYVRSVDIKDGRITLNFVFPLKYKNNNLIEALEEKVKKSIEDQFLEVYDLFDSYGLRLYKDIKCIEDYSETSLEDIPDDLERYILEVRRNQATIVETDHMLEALESNLPEVRKCAAEALGKLGDSRAVEPLIQIINDKNWEVRSKAIEALGKLGDIRALETLFEAFKEGDRHTRFNVIYALHNFRDGRVVDILIQALTDADYFVRCSAAKELGEFRDVRALESLIQALQDKEPLVRSDAVHALMKINDKRAIDPVIQALKDENDMVRRSAVLALGVIGGIEAIEHIIQALRNDSAVRDNAIAILNDFRDSRAVEPIIQALSDDDKNVRYSAARALGDFEDIRALKPLIQALNDDEYLVRRGVLYGLWKIKDSRAVEPLIRTLQDVDPVARCWAAFSLGEFGDARAVEPLTRVLMDEDHRVRKRAAKSLQQLGWKGGDK